MGTWHYFTLVSWQKRDQCEPYGPFSRRRVPGLGRSVTAEVRQIVEDYARWDGSLREFLVYEAARLQLAPQPSAVYGDHRPAPVQAEQGPSLPRRPRKDRAFFEQIQVRHGQPTSREHLSSQPLARALLEQKRLGLEGLKFGLLCSHDDSSDVQNESDNPEKQLRLFCLFQCQEVPDETV